MDKSLTPQDKAINQSIPVQCYEIHEWEGKLYGSIIDWKPSWQAIRDYEVHFDFRGQEAHYLLLSDDRSITRQEALVFATCLFEKKYRTIHIELGGL
jgi:hypothetical protein